MSETAIICICEGVEENDWEAIQSYLRMMMRLCAVEDSLQGLSHILSSSLKQPFIHHPLYSANPSRAFRAIESRDDEDGGECDPISE